MSELERPIEKLLRASAEERRRKAGGPFELHPATHRLLQGEVARQYRHPAPATAPQRQWFQFWPRLAWSLGTFLVLGMAAFITWQSHQSAREDQLSVADRSVTNTNQSAKNEAAIALAPTPFAPTAEAPTARPTPVRVPGAEVASSIDPESQPPPAAIPPRTAPGPTRSASRTLESEVTKTKTTDKAAVLADASARRSDATAPSASSPGQKLPGIRSEPSTLSAAAAPAATVPMTATSGAADRGRAVALAEPSQAYMFHNQIQTPPVTNTLVAFTVEQNGTDLKVIDADGSVYTGQVLVADMLPVPQSRVVQSRQFGAGGGVGNEVLRSQTPAQSQSQFMNQNVLNFRVAGTNRSLNQNVVFTGNFVPADETANAQIISNVTAIQNNRVSNQNQLRNRQQQLQELLPWNNGRISGQAVLDNKQTIAIEASPSQK